MPRKKVIGKIRKVCRGDEMDTGQVLALAGKYSAAADEVESSAHNLKNAINLLSLDWSGKGRDEFISEFEETLQAFTKHAEDCRETSEELKSAAAEIEKVNEEKKRLEELRRQAMINAKLNDTFA